MKPSLRDYLVTVAAILVVFACGYGIGHQLGARQRAAPAVPDSDLSWEGNVFERLDSELELTESQRKAIRDELDASSRKIDEIKGKSRQSFREELLDLHQRISPLLDESQRRRLDKSRAALQHSSSPVVSP